MSLTDIGLLMLCLTFVAGGALWGMAMGGCLVFAVQWFCDHFGCKCNK